MKDKSPRITLCSIKNYCLSFLFPVFFFIFLSFSLSFFLSPLHISSVSKSARMSRSSFTASQAALARAHNCLFTLMSWNCRKQNKDDTAHFERVTETKTRRNSTNQQGNENAAQMVSHCTTGQKYGETKWPHWTIQTLSCLFFFSFFRLEFYRHKLLSVTYTFCWSLGNS